MDLFFERIRASPAFATFEDARGFLDATLNEIEDQFSGVPFNPARWRTDGRLYPVQDDKVFDVPGHPEVSLLWSRGHDTFIRQNGAIEVRHRRTNTVVIAKPGADGKGVWQ